MTNYDIVKSMLARAGIIFTSSKDCITIHSNYMTVLDTEEHNVTTLITFDEDGKLEVLRSYKSEHY